MQVYKSDRASVGRQSGSWLLNLILVIFICFIVAAVLFPIFARSGDYSPRCNCQNNMKELAVAFQVYWNDYDSKLPSSFLVSHSKTWNTPDFLRFATKLGKIPTTGHKETYVQVLYDHMKNKDIMWCPSDTADHANPGSNVSYYWKTAIDKAWYGERCTKPCQKEMDFVYNADQVIFYERRGFHCDEDGIKNGTQINVAFLDSHVKSITVRNATSGDPKHPAANTDGEPMYFNFDTKTNKALPEGVPARWVDPQRYCDRL